MVQWYHSLAYIDEASGTPRPPRQGDGGRRVTVRMCGESWASRQPGIWPWLWALISYFDRDGFFYGKGNNGERLSVQLWLRCHVVIMELSVKKLIGVFRTLGIASWPHNCKQHNALFYVCNLLPQHIFWKAKRSTCYQAPSRPINGAKCLISASPPSHCCAAAHHVIYTAAEPFRPIEKAVSSAELFAAESLQAIRIQKCCAGQAMGCFATTGDTGQLMGSFVWKGKRAIV